MTKPVSTFESIRLDGSLRTLALTAKICGKPGLIRNPEEQGEDLRLARVGGKRLHPEAKADGLRRHVTARSTDLDVPTLALGAVRENDEPQVQALPVRGEFSESIIRESRVLERILEVEYGFLDQDHPVSKYLNERIKHLFPNESLTVKVAENEDEPNGLSLATGTIIITKGLLKILDTQDEIDVILAHEAIHYIEAHVSEIQVALDEARARHQSKKASRGDTLRILSRMRYAEYEADIKGLLAATKGNVNPAAARSAFLKLDEYDKNKKGQRGIVHGGNVDRIINIGIAGQLRDFEASSKPQDPLPDFVNAFANQGSRDWLFDRLKTVSVDDIPALIQFADINELLLTLNRIEHGKVSFGADEKVKKFKAEVLPIIMQKIETEFPEQSPEENRTLAQGLLELCAGIRTDESVGTVYENFMESFVEITDEASLRDQLRIFNPEVFGRIDAILPRFTDTAQFIGMILRSANENEVFVGDNGEFDLARYLDFAQWAVKHFEALTKEFGLQPIHIEELTEFLISEAVLNLDLRGSNQPLYDMIEGFRQAGIALDPFRTIEVIQGQAHSRQDEDEIERIKNKLIAEDPFWHLFPPFPEETPQIYSLSDYFFRTEVFVIDRAKFRVDYAEAVVAKFEPKSVSELQNFLSWLAEKTSGHLPINVRDMLIVVMITLIRMLIEKGAPFLTKAKGERCIEIIAILCSHNHGEIRSIVSDIMTLVTYDGWDVISDSNPQDRLKEILALGSVIDGSSEIFARLGLVSIPFCPTRLSSYDGAMSFKREDREIKWGTVAFTEMTDNELIEVVCYLYYWELDDDYFAGCSKQEANSYLKDLQTYVYKHLYYMPKSSTNKSINGEYKLVDHNVVARIFRENDFDLDDAEDQDLLLDLSILFVDPSLTARLQHAILRRRMERMPFEDRLSLLFQDPRTRMSMTKDLRERFIEDEVLTHDEVEQTLAVFEDAVAILSDSEGLGALAILEQVSDLIPDKKNLFKTLMEMGEGDSRLRDVFFGLIREDSPDEVAIIEAEILIEQIEGSNDMVRYAVVRQLLVGEGGFLHSVAGRHWLLDYFYSSHITPSSGAASQNLNEIVREVLNVSIEHAPTDMLFFAIAPLIHERIMRRPEKETDWDEILMGYYQDKKAVRETLVVSAAIQRGERGIIKFAGEERVIERGDIAMEYSAAVNTLLSGEQDQGRQDQQKWSVEQFTVKLAEALGSPGVRFLQIIGQYVDMPPDLEKAFQDVYDNVKGQSKLTAYETIEREWLEFRDEVKRVVRRLGGGSLMSVYLCEKADGTFEVIKVLNPNAQMQLDITMALLRQTFDALVAKNPERYAVARAAIDEIEAWIYQDLNYDQFIERDQVFGKTHDGFAAARHDYKIYIPQSKSFHEDGRDNYYIKREEHIDGQTLTRPEELEGHDLKQIASLLAKNYVHQIMTGLVHSDVHPGNFMVFTGDEGQKYVAVIDRNNYIELDSADQMLLFSLQGAVGSGDVKNVVRQVGNYIAAKQGLEIDDLQWARLERAAQVNGDSDVTKMISQVMLVFKQEQIPVPLKLTLMVKNLNGLRHLVERAGFDSLLEAVAYAA